MDIPLKVQDQGLFCSSGNAFDENMLTSDLFDTASCYEELEEFIV